MQLSNVFCVVGCFNSASEVADGLNGPDMSYESLFEGSGYPRTGDIPILNRKIFKGYRVGIREHPYVVSVRRQFCHYLTAALVSKNLVLSIAHPLHLVPINELGVVVGQNYSDRGTSLLTVVLVLIHEGFDPYTLRNDIAIIRIHEDVYIRPAVKYIKFIRSLRQLNNSDAFVTGWGRCEFTGRELCFPRESIYYPHEKMDPMLRSISFRVTLPNFYCDGYRRQEVPLSEGMLCVGVAREEDPVSACLAVPGAPLVADGMLAGLQSWGFGCGYSHDLPLVYTSIPFYLPWISKNVGLLNQIVGPEFRELFLATRAYITYTWLSETRVNKPSWENANMPSELQQSELDTILADLQGYYYDVRDFVANNKYHESKLRMVNEIRYKANKLSEVNSTGSYRDKTKPFINSDWIGYNGYNDENFDD